MTYSKQHAKVVRLEVSIGSEHGEDDRVIEDFVTAIHDALTTNPDVGAHNVTVNGSYYILDGKVCLPEDYDPAKKDRKPGTHPPSWAGGPAKGTTVVEVQPDEEKPHDFVRVKPTRSNERDPATGRRYRSDRGKKRPTSKETKAA